MEAIRYPKRRLTIYHSPRRKIPEHMDLQHNDKNLKFRANEEIPLHSKRAY
jgi:hypothetical protein